MHVIHCFIKPSSRFRVSRNSPQGKYTMVVEAYITAPVSVDLRNYPIHIASLENIKLVVC